MLKKGEVQSEERGGEGKGGLPFWRNKQYQERASRYRCVVLREGQVS